MNKLLVRAVHNPADPFTCWNLECNLHQGGLWRLWLDGCEPGHEFGTLAGALVHLPRGTRKAITDLLAIAGFDHGLGT